jgi:negative regulator of flagellin synthesis FlgM
MTDKIDGQGHRPLDLTGTSRKLGVQDGPDASRATSSGNQSAGDTVSFTRSALLLGRLEELVASTPVVSNERVDAIRQALASGAYEVDAHTVADKLIQSESDLA